MVKKLVLETFEDTQLIGGLLSSGGEEAPGGEEAAWWGHIAIAIARDGIVMSADFFQQFADLVGGALALNPDVFVRILNSKLAYIPAWFW